LERLSAREVCRSRFKKRSNPLLARPYTSVERCNE
jgi:hypothetical protein